MIFKFEKQRTGITDWYEISDQPGLWMGDDSDIVAYILEYLIVRCEGRRWRVKDIERVDRRLKDADKVSVL